MPLSPNAEEFLAAVAAQNRPAWQDMSLRQARDTFAGLTDVFGEGPEVAHVEDRTIANDVPVRIYTPAGDGPFPAIVYFHGGGWVLGDLDTHDALCRQLANDAQTVVISVHYRRSPEAVAPAAVDDCCAATQFVANEGASINVDPTQIVVAGDSAGGGLAAAVSIKARDEDGPAIRQQVLIYPVLDSRCETASYHEFLSLIHI